MYASALDVTWERARRGDDRGTGATVRVSIRSFGGGAGWRREVEARRWMRGRGGAGAEARRRRGGDRARARSRARFESLTNRGRAGGREHAPPYRGRRWRERRRGRRGSYRVRRWRASSSSLDALTPQSGSLRKWREAATWTSWQPEEPNVNVIRSEATTGIFHFYQTARHTSTDGTRLARSSSRILRRVFTLASAISRRHFPIRFDEPRVRPASAGHRPRPGAPSRYRRQGVIVVVVDRRRGPLPPRPPVLRCVRRPPTYDARHRAEEACISPPASSLPLPVADPPRASRTQPRWPRLWPPRCP